MFEPLERLPDDPILGLMAAFRADTNPRKIDLGVGVYRDEHGNTPVLEAVRRAEQALLARQATKTYVAPSGNAGFNQALERLVFGEGHPALAARRVRTLQTPGGCGALRVGAELVRAASPAAVVYVSTPTWANHVPLLSGAGIRLERYPYYDAATGGVRFGEVVSALERLPAASVVLLHGACHNPTGADFDERQWRELLEVFRSRKLVPYIDLAYQGLGTGLAEDAFGVRLFAEHLPELVVAVSCSKNFGLYRERVGALHVLADSSEKADVALTHLVRIARTLYSMPPDHGAAIVHEVLSDPELATLWHSEISAMRMRIGELRRALVERLGQSCPARDFSFIERQRGMFSYLGIEVAEVRALREQHHVYMTDDSRINVAGLSSKNLDAFAQALSSVLAPRA